MNKSATDNQEFVENMQKYAEEFQKIAENFFNEQQLKEAETVLDPLNFTESFMNMTNYYAQNPDKLVENQMSLWKDYMNLWQNTARKMMGEDDVEAVITPEKGDRRFKDEDWEENQVFDYIKQSYLLTGRWLKQTVSESHDADDHEGQKLDFYTSQFIDAMSPTNFAATNPQVIRETIAQKGQNLLHGLENIARDIDPKTGQIHVRMTDEDAFEAGRNVATTPGKVVYQNELIQLIQYEPTTEKVFKTPLLIIPPWINKFYILDLQEKNSLVKWLTDKGYNVFIISWRNPDESCAEISYDDYMMLAPLAAIDAIEKATGEEKVNAVGYCAGGTLLAATLAVLEANNRADCIKSATFFVAQVDFSEAGELSLFVDEKQLQVMNKMMDEKGYLDGSIMSNTFNMLRSNDLIWSYVISNYLLGKDPFPFDLLYWNSDNTRLTKACHKQYLKELYMENNMVKPGKMVVNNTPIDLTQVKTPSYIQAAHTDHICPWKSVYKMTQQFTGERRFMLAGSGHIAGVVNPPAANKYNHWTNDELPPTADEWFDGAEEHPGSWWDDWHNWLKKKSGTKVAARVPGAGDLDIIEEAPGSYVKVKY